MSDTLYLSLWYPNLRLEGLADKLTAVLGAFAAHGGEARVYSATVWPVSWSETPIYQQVYGRRSTGGQGSAAPSALGAEPRAAVAEALELLHDDYAYEFQIGWSLWELEKPPEKAGPSTSVAAATSAQDDSAGWVGRAVDVEALKAIPGVQSHRVDEGVHQLSVTELHTTVPRIFAAIEAQGLHLSEFKTHSATLEDVFVRLTGRNLRDE